MNIHLKNSEIIRKEIEHLLPPKGPIDFEKLNINVRYLINTSADISSGIPLSMNSLIANYSMSNFISQFQWKMQLGSSKIPTNMVGFLLSGSGKGKDSTISAQSKALAPGYIVIEQKRKEKAVEAAKKRAEVEDGETTNWLKFFKQPQPLENAISTVEGLTSRLNNFASAGIGMPSILVSELGSELATNQNMTDNIRLIAELYDEGNKKSKAIKDTERQDTEVKGMGMNALFVGSEDNLIMDKQISQKFKQEFITKFARRTILVYPSKKEFEECIISYRDYADMKERQVISEDKAHEAKAYIGSASTDVAHILVNSDKRILEIDEDALQAYKDYKLYTSSLGDGLDFLHKSVQLEQLHRSWKMLKLAGVYALWDLSETVKIEHIKEAIYYIEKVGDYLKDYEEYASKENYELLCDYFQVNPERKLSLHELKKRGFISGTTSLESRVKDLLKIADSLAGSSGAIKYENGVMSFVPFKSVDGNHWASFVQVSGTKDVRATQCYSGFEAKEVNFLKLKNLLDNDTAYTPFKFANGHRKNDNIISGATWIALDVDDSDCSISEMHDMLDGINHHIATTSNSENIYKFRIMIEFNNIVDLPVREWKVFGKELGKEFGINIDPVTFTKSQIMFGYKGAKVFSTTDCEPFDVSDCVKIAGTKIKEGFEKRIKPTRTQAASLLEKPLDTFSFAFSDKGMKTRSLSLFKMWKFAKDLGASEDDCEKLMSDLNYSFWDNPISDSRFEARVLQMRNSFKETT